MEKEIVLPQDVRVFRTSRGNILARVGLVLPAGTRLTIGEPCSKFYDHRDQVAVPIIDYDLEQFLLLKEIGLPELTN